MNAELITQIEDTLDGIFAEAVQSRDHAQNVLSSVQTFRAVLQSKRLDLLREQVNARSQEGEQHG